MNEPQTITDETFDLDVLRNIQGFWYLASPYSKYPYGTEEAFRQVALASAWLITRGVRIFCPITHSHPISVHGNLPLDDHDLWLPADRPMMDAAFGIIVCMMESWQESYGVGVEIETFVLQGKPVRYMEWNR